MSNPSLKYSSNYLFAYSSLKFVDSKAVKLISIGPIFVFPFQQIPPKFMKHLSNDMGDRATLKGPSDDAWTIVVHEKNNGTYLQDGWQDFMRFHSLGKNEFLLFRYDGNSHFSVRIYDQSGLERQSESVITGKHREARKMEAESSTGRRKQGRPRKNNVNPDNLHQSNSCKEGEGIHAFFR